MKFENNLRFKSLNYLEKKKAETIPAEASFLVSRIITLRQLALNEYSIEDMRIMIEQNEGLNYLIPLALEILNENILAEGDYYEGDLLQAVINSDPGFWQRNHDLYLQISRLVKQNAIELTKHKINIEKFLCLN